MTDDLNAHARDLGQRLADATLAAASDTVEFMRGVHDRDPDRLHKSLRLGEQCDYCEFTKPKSMWRSKR